MTQHLTINNNQAPLPAGVNAGAVAIEQERAIAEAQGQLTLAKRFPRDLNAAHADWTAALDQYKPRVRIVECNVPHSVVKGQDK